MPNGSKIIFNLKNNFHCIPDFKLTKEIHDHEYFMGQKEWDKWIDGRRVGYGNALINYFEDVLKIPVEEKYKKIFSPLNEHVIYCYECGDLYSLSNKNKILLKKEFSISKHDKQFLSFLERFTVWSGLCSTCF